ncbi:MAG: hypothetical protein Q8P38_06330 [Candidatus Nanopelagicales bacterium]|nr:hypothetical protein [Candidatus Nanopelagicales bacterium]
MTSLASELGGSELSAEGRRALALAKADAQSALVMVRYWRRKYG